MDASAISNEQAGQFFDPGRFTKVSVQTKAGELEARLSDYGNWEVRIRPHGKSNWRQACTGDLDSGAVTAQPVVLPEEESIVRGRLTIDPGIRRLRVGDDDVALTRKEFSLLLALASQPNRVMHRSELLESVWGMPGDSGTRSVDSHVSRLRRKLAEAGAPEMVINCWGVGWRLWDRPDLTISEDLEVKERHAA